MQLAPIALILVFVMFLLYNTIKILKEYERGVIFFLGRFQSVKGPGLIILIPGLQKNDQGGPARHRTGCANTGCYFARQRVGKS